jgi:dTDP-4-dehydrorhamnose 3,5-epimerase
MNLKETEIPDCYLINSFHHQDERGGFVKPYHSHELNEKAFDYKIKEIYYTWSKPNVFRGFHFQTPPNDHAKIVFCNYGGVIDYVVDLRKESGVYGQIKSFEINEVNRRAILIPKGCAHGFYVPDQDSMLTYLVESVYNPESDTGILWSSFDYNFEFNDPIISDRDSKFMNYQGFKSPFK